MRVGIIGTGHVGIVSAVCLASLGHRVVGTDHDAAKIAMLKDGGAPFFEEAYPNCWQAASTAGH